MYVKDLGVIRQLDIRLHGYGSSEEALDQLGDAIDPDESVAMLSHRGELYELNSVGLLLWDRIATLHDDEELVTYIAAHFDIDRDLAATDVGAFLDSMTELGLLSRDSTRPPA